MTIYAFGPFVLDVPAAELRKNGHKIPLRPKCFDLLVHLVERRGNLVTRGELLETIWADVVVSEATLSRTVASLRAALEDDPAKPQYIETVSRRGYKFVGTLQEPAAASPPVGLSLIHGAKEYALRPGAQVIGRGRDVHIPLFTPSTSRHHARIDVAGDTVTLEDLGSTHGTFVNGNKVSGSVLVQAGDEIEIGGERLILWSPSSETSPEPPPRRG
jgi:DNA-binding winged helix-turn-helix (wHTH) protein